MRRKSTGSILSKISSKSGYSSRNSQEKNVGRKTNQVAVVSTNIRQKIEYLDEVRKTEVNNNLILSTLSEA